MDISEIIDHQSPVTIRYSWFSARSVLSFEPLCLLATPPTTLAWHASISCVERSPPPTGNILATNAKTTIDMRAPYTKSVPPAIRSTSTTPPIKEALSRPSLCCCRHRVNLSKEQVAGLVVPHQIQLSSSTPGLCGTVPADKSKNESTTPPTQARIPGTVERRVSHGCTKIETKSKIVT